MHLCTKHLSRLFLKCWKISLSLQFKQASFTHRDGDWMDGAADAVCNNAPSGCGLTCLSPYSRLMQIDKWVDWCWTGGEESLQGSKAGRNIMSSEQSQLLIAARSATKAMQRESRVWLIFVSLGLCFTIFKETNQDSITIGDSCTFLRT